jgi:hypothetical protein
MTFKKRIKKVKISPVLCIKVAALKPTFTAPLGVDVAQF